MSEQSGSLVPTTYMMSCRAVAPIFMYADERGMNLDGIFENVGYDEKWVREPRNQITWTAFVRLVENFEDEIGGPKELENLKALMVPSFGHIAGFLGLLTSPARLYRWLNRWAGPSVFPHINHYTQESDEGPITVKLEIPPDAEDCPAFFRVSKLMFEVAPTIVGGKQSRVEFEIGKRLGIYEIHAPPSYTLWARIKRAWLSLTLSEQVINELHEQQGELHEKHLALQQSHRDLSASEANFHNLLDRMPDGVAVLVAGEVRYANPALCEFLRVEYDELQRESLTKYLASGDLADTVGKVLGTEGQGRVDVEFVRSDGSIAVGNLTPIDAMWDHASALVLVIQDTTERNRLMDRALQLDRMVSVGTMAAGVAHEINNPMAFVHSNLQYAREILDDNAPFAGPEARSMRALSDAIDEALDGSQRVRDIVRDLKSFSRPAEETRLPVDLVEAVRAAMNMSWHEVRGHAKVRTEYDEVPKVLANAGRLSQVVLNLVINAVQAMPERNSELNMITIRTLRGEDRGVIEVEDNGMGIEREHLRRIFDPFFTTKPLGTGTGLGLWICQDIITRIGGELTVTSEVDRGTLFRVELPYADPMDANAPVEVAVGTEPGVENLKETVVAPAPATAAVRVLLIDDEPKLLRLVQRILTNCEVIGFSEPHRAMSHLQKDDDFDVVLCDATMPGLNGRDIYMRLQAEYPNLAERFVLVTGGLTQSWERTDFPCIVQKPFNIEKLRSVVSLVANTPDLVEPPSIH